MVVCLKVIVSLDMAVQPQAFCRHVVCSHLLWASIGSRLNAATHMADSNLGILLMRIG